MHGDESTKRALLEKLLEAGMVMVTVDARHQDVEVPPGLEGDPQLRLNLSHRFGLPMDVTNWGVEATLTFGGHPFGCRLPWHTVYIMFSHVSGHPYVFPRNVPGDVLAGSLEDATPVEEGDSPDTHQKRPALRVVSPTPEEASEPDLADDEPEPPPPGRPRGRGHLRVVK